jgi:sugar phosphate isomerase/epimerase
MLTHYSLDTLDADSRIWIETWIAAHGVELYLAGHRHFTRTRRVAGCLEVITRGLDPDKAFGGPPGISLLQRTTDGDWTEQAIPWPHGRDLLPAETEHSPVGWSIRGNPVETVRETYDFGLNVLELRPREADYDLATTVAELKKLRGDRPVYLSWHLTNLAWDVSSSTVSGQDLVAQQVDHAQACGADAFTVHVPQIGAHLMDQGNDEWQAFLRAFEALFKQAIDDGVRLSIENVHNDPGTALAREGRKFATHIDEYETWIRSVISALGTDSSRIGAHFDIGHARNNGELGNLQPIGDWYACIGRYITGYHIHQVRPHEETHKLVNHRDIKSTYDRTISYAGFLHAWSNRLINRAPLFVEVRKAEERRRTTRLLLDIIAGEAE